MKIFRFIYLFLVFFIKKIVFFIKDISQIQVIIILLLISLVYFKFNLFSVDIYNNSCSSIVWIKDWYCNIFPTVQSYIFLPEFIFYWLIVLLLIASLRWSRKSWKINNEVYFLFPLLPFFLLRLISVFKYNNSLFLFINEYYYLIGYYWIYSLILFFMVLISFEKEDINGFISFLRENKIKSWNKVPEIKKEEKKEFIDNKDTKKDTVVIIKQSLPSILDKIFYTVFKKNTTDEEWNRIDWIYSLNSVKKVWEDEYMVDLSISDELLMIVDSLSKYDWTLWINSYGKIEWFISWKWFSKEWKTGLIIKTKWETISFKWAFDYPYLLEKNPLIKKPLEVIVWKNEKWEDVVCNIAKCPHLLLAWKTWWWKSVWMLDLLVGLLKNRMDWVHLNITIIDPKRVDYSKFEWLQWLKVIWEIWKWLNALKYFEAEMLRRYQLLEKEKVENIEEYHKLWLELSYEVIIIDELSNFMNREKDIKGEAENKIARIWEMARASGIHLIIWTQRPDASVVTWLIKANIPSVLWFWVTNSINSRIIMDSNILTSVKEIWEAYLKVSWKDKIEHLKTYFIDKSTSLVDFINYYREKTEGVPVDLNNNEGIPVHQKKEKGTPVHLNNDLQKFESIIDEYLPDIDKTNKSYFVLRELIKNKGYKSRNELYSTISIYWISKSLTEKMISNIKSKWLVEYSDSDKINKITSDINKDYILILYNSIYNILWDK